VLQTADCVPLLMWESRGNVVAAVHAGWRGTSAGIASRAVGYIEKELVSPPDCVHVAVGPAIGKCCYEVGDEVRRAFLEAFPDAGDLFSRGKRGRNHLDLAEANRRQLVDAGVPPDQIYTAEVCTSCDNDVLYSYRREGQGVGRLFGIVGVAR
jgi:YfiH family protein